MQCEPDRGCDTFSSSLLVVRPATVTASTALNLEVSSNEAQHFQGDQFAGWKHASERSSLLLVSDGFCQMDNTLPPAAMHSTNRSTGVARFARTLSCTLFVLVTACGVDATGVRSENPEVGPGVQGSGARSVNELQFQSGSVSGAPCTREGDHLVCCPMVAMQRAPTLGFRAGAYTESNCLVIYPSGPVPVPASIAPGPIPIPPAPPEPPPGYPAPGWTPPPLQTFDPALLGGGGGTQPPEVPQPGCNSTRAEVPGGLPRPRSRRLDICTGSESPAVRMESDEFEALLMQGGLNENALDEYGDCVTGFEPDCSPEQQLRARLSQIGPAAVNWVLTIAGDAYWAIKAKLTIHNAVTGLATAAVLVPLSVIAPEAGAIGVTIRVSTWEHVAARHFASSEAVNASKFLSTYSNEAGVVGLVSAALKQQGTVVQFFNRYTSAWDLAIIRTVQLEQTVGFDRALGYAPTNYYSIITTMDGFLKTIHPGLPGGIFRIPVVP